MYNIQHGHKTTVEAYYDGQLVGSKQEIEESRFTSKESLLKDVLEYLAMINKGTTNKLDIGIKIDAKGRYRLVTKWIIL